MQKVEDNKYGYEKRCNCDVICYEFLIKLGGNFIDIFVMSCCNSNNQIFIAPYASYRGAGVVYYTSALQQMQNIHVSLSDVDVM